MCCFLRRKKTEHAIGRLSRARKRENVEGLAAGVLRREMVEAPTTFKAGKC